MNEEFLTGRMSGSQKSDVKPEKDYESVDELFDDDLLFITNKIISLEAHVYTLNNIVNELNTLSKSETNNEKRFNYYKGINRNLELIAELSDVIHKFSNVKHKYRSSQSDLVHRRIMNSKIHEKSLSVTDLIDMFKNFTNDGAPKSVIDKSIKEYENIKLDLESDNNYDLS
jgi:hypothetical protein